MCLGLREAGARGASGATERGLRGTQAQSSVGRSLQSGRVTSPGFRGKGKGRGSRQTAWGSRGGPNLHGKCLGFTSNSNRNFKSGQCKISIYDSNGNSAFRLRFPFGAVFQFISRSEPSRLASPAEQRALPPSARSRCEDS